MKDEELKKQFLVTTTKLSEGDVNNFIGIMSIGKELGLNRPNTFAIVRELEADGLIKYRTDAGDIISVTDSGINEAVRILAESLSPEEAAKEDHEEKEDKEREEKIKKREEEIQEREEEMREREEEILEREEEMKKREAEISKREEEEKDKEKEDRKKEDEIRKEEESKREKEEKKREEEVRKREEDVRKREDEVRKREKEIRKREGEVLKREEEESKREEDLSTREDQERKLEKELSKWEDELKEKEDEIDQREKEIQKKEEEQEKKRKEEKLGNDILVVHSHDDEAKDMTLGFIDELGLNPIILRDTPDSGTELFDRFEDHKNIGFAIVVLNPDDIGETKIERCELRHRVNQSLIFELGFLVGKLGWNRVCALYEEGIDIPASNEGIIYVQMDKEGKWKKTIAREIKTAELEVEADKIIQFY